MVAAAALEIDRGTLTPVISSGLMDYLAIDKFPVMGFGIGGPLIWNLLRRARRAVAAVLAQPSGFRPEMPDLFYQNNIKGWRAAPCARSSEISWPWSRPSSAACIGALEISCLP